jgi:hypothetical protein
MRDMGGSLLLVLIPWRWLRASSLWINLERNSTPINKRKGNIRSSIWMELPKGGIHWYEWKKRQLKYTALSNLSILNESQEMRILRGS